MPGLDPQPVRIEKINGTPKRRNRATRKIKKKKGKVTARGSTAIRLYCYVPQRKGLLSSAKGKRRVKRRVRRRRFSSPFASDEDTATGDESDISSYTSSRPHRPSRPRPTSSDSTGSEGESCDDGKMEAVSERSRMAVIYEQQSWEGEIVDERDMKQGRGRPRKQYLVRWEPSWVDGGRLTSRA